MDNKISILVTKTITETKMVEPSEWVMQALAGNKINAIKALRAAVRIKKPSYNHNGDLISYYDEIMGLKTAKDIVESMFKD